MELLKQNISYMIHQSFNKAEVANRYYHEISPYRYTKEQARKQFNQDNNIDKKILKKVIKDIFKEQIRMMK